VSLFAKVRTLVVAHANDLVDKTVDMDSIPVLRQYVRDLEDAIAKSKHEAAVAAANVTTLTNSRDLLQKTLDADTQRTKLLLAKNDEAGARSVAGRIHDSQQEIASLNDQITAATDNSKALDGAVAKMDAKHQEIMSQLRMLESKDRSAKSLHQATASLKEASAITDASSEMNVDNIAQRIDQRSNEEREEFNRTVSGMTPEPDPLKDAAVDDILNSLREKQPAA
jgi:phage shock protein A